MDYEENVAKAMIIVSAGLLACCTFTELCCNKNPNKTLPEKQYLKQEKSQEYTLPEKKYHLRYQLDELRNEYNPIPITQVGDPHGI